MSESESKNIIEAIDNVADSLDRIGDALMMLANAHKYAAVKIEDVAEAITKAAIPNA